MAIIRKSQARTQSELNRPIYSDVFTNLDIHPNKQDLVLHVNEDSVKRSIKNILLTNRGEKLFNPFFGSDVRAILFENFSPQSETLLREYVTNAIQNFEPRANLLNVIISPLIDQNAYGITVIFSTINNIEPVTLEILLDRVR
jgi:phage baseplate assembly protein W